MKTYVPTNTCTWMFVSTVFVSAMFENNTNVFQWVNKHIVIHLYNLKLFVNKKEQANDINTLGEFQRHYDEFLKLIFKGCIFWNSIYVRFLKSQYYNDKEQISIH